MNDELSSRERADMRDLVVAGAQRIRPAGRHRTQLLAGAIALVLVGGVTGGALATAALLGSEAPGPVATSTRSETPTPTPSTDPAPTATPEPPAPTGPAVAFGGECANTLTDDEVDALRGMSMIRADYRWETGANAVLGGIDCVWLSEEEYLAATLHLYAYPDSVVPAAVRDATVPGCVDIAGEIPRVSCSAVGVVDGTWLLVRAEGSPDQISAAGVDTLYGNAADRVTQHPAAVPVTRTAEWWESMECGALLGRIDPAIYGFERVALLDEQAWQGEPTAGPGDIAATAASHCELHFTSGSGDTSSGEVVSIWIVPGGAIGFQSVIDSEGSQPVTVDGAQAAVIAPGLDRYEGSPSTIVVTDGVNVLMVTPDWGADTARAAPLAAIVLAFLEGR